MEKENIIEILKQRADKGDINSKIVLALNKINRKSRKRYTRINRII